MDGAQLLVHVMPATEGHSAWVEVGMVNWVTLGIAVFDDGQTVHESHPGKNVRVLEGLRQGTAMSSMTSNPIPVISLRPTEPNRLVSTWLR